ncbi:MAG: SpoIIE family protein phosphatase [Prevotella sp.]|nr:SpoIIE family protein phosphatase [Prevotella sp.]
MRKPDRKTKLWLTLISAAFFFTAAYPFRKGLADVPYILELRPENAAAPVLGLLFGIYGAAGAAFGSAAASFAAESGAGSGILEAALVFFQSYVTHIIWYGSESEISPPSMKNISQAVRYTAIALAVSVVPAFFRSVCGAGFGSFAALWINGFDVSVSVGMPVLWLAGGAGIPFIVTEITHDGKFTAPRLGNFPKSRSLRVKFTRLCFFVGAAAVVLAALTAGGMSCGEPDAAARSIALTAAGAAANAVFLSCAFWLKYIADVFLVPIENAAKDMRSFAEHSAETGEEFIPRQTPRKFLCSEAEELSEAFAVMTSAVGRKMCELEKNAAERGRAEAETEAADMIQTLLLPPNGSFSFCGVEAEIFTGTVRRGRGGGNVCDFFKVGDRRTALFIAEADGKNISEAMFFFAACRRVRMLMNEGLSPAETLNAINRPMHESCGDMVIALWLGLLELDTGKLTYSGAAHDPPILAHSGRCGYLDSDVNIFFACLENAVYREKCVYLGKNDMLFLYTDGLVRASNGEGNSYGAGRLMKAAGSCCGMDCEAAVNSVFRSVDLFCGDRQSEQAADRSLLVMKIHYSDSVTLAAEKENIPALNEFAENCLARLKCPEDKITKFVTAVEEAAANICGAYPEEKKGTVTLQCLYDRKKRRYSVVISDTGARFNPLLAPKADTDCPVGGLGIHIVRQLMDDVRYRYSGGKNILTMSLKK